MRAGIEATWLCDQAPLLVYADWLWEQGRDLEAERIAEVTEWPPAERWLHWTGRSTKQVHGLWVWDDEEDCCLNWNYRYHGGRFSAYTVKGYLPTLFRRYLKHHPSNQIDNLKVTGCSGGWYYGAYYVASAEAVALHALAEVYDKFMARRDPVPLQRWPDAYLECLYAPKH